MRKTWFKVPSIARTTVQPWSAQTVESTCCPRFDRTMKRLSAAAGLAVSRARQSSKNTMRCFMYELSRIAVFHPRLAKFNQVIN